MSPELARRFFDNARKNELDFITKDGLNLSANAIVAECDAMDEAADVVDEEAIESDEGEAPAQDEWTMDWTPFTF